MRGRVLLGSVVGGSVLLATGACDSDAGEERPPRGSIVENTEDRSLEPGPDPSKELAKPRGTSDWRMKRPSVAGQIEAYTTQQSGVPGTRLGFKVSTTEGRFRVHAYRIGAYRGSGEGALVWSSRPVRGVKQPEARFAQYRTRTVVAPWRRSLTVDTTGWKPGLYVFRLRTGSGWEAQVPYVVSSPTAADTIALVVPVTTWQAYNVWGGYSLYHSPSGDQRAWAVSFDRPYLDVGGMNDFRNAVIPIIVRAERTGVPVSFFTNLDLHEDEGALAGARGYVSTGHDEYWTREMRERVLAARDTGTNIAFLGANTMYWKVRLEDRSTGPVRLMTGYRSDAYLDPLRETRPWRATGLFRDPPAAAPENDLTGMLYECFPVSQDYRIVTPGWWGFKGTKVRTGTVIPDLVGLEADRVYPNARTPRPLQILSNVGYSCRGDQTSAQSVYYTTPSGAGVFNAGTLRWGCALVDRCDIPISARTQEFAGKVTANLMRGFIRGPVGSRHPARDNLDDFDLPLTNGVTAS